MSLELKNLFPSIQNLQVFNYVGFSEVLIFCAILLVWTLVRKSLASKKGIVIPPGPVGLPIVGYLPFLGNEPHKTLVKLKKKYGDIIGLYMGRRYTVFLNEYHLAKEVLTHPGSQDRPTDVLFNLAEVGFGALNGESWQEQRKFCFSATKELGVGKGAWEDSIMENAQDFAQTLQNFGGKPVDISGLLISSICSNIISLLVGRRLRTKEEADITSIAVKYADEALAIVGPSNPVGYIPVLYKLLVYLKIGKYENAANIAKNFSMFIKEEIFRHKTSKDCRDVHDFMNLYLQKLSEMTSSGKGKHYFSENTLEGNINILFIGASDTVFSSVGWLLRLMSKHKDIQEKVRAELIEVYGKDESAKYEERDRIPYTFAVMMETQRFASVVPLSSFRRASQDIKIRGYTIPKGSLLSANLWFLHHDPDYWEDPHVFRPERFLNEDGTKLIKTLPGYAPFSMGRRYCPGEIIGWMETLAYFTTIIKKFEVSTPPGVEPNFTEHSGLVTRLVPQPLCFKERSD